MKKQIIYSILSLSILAACSSLEEESILSDQKMVERKGALQIEVSANDFMLDGKIDTRAADKGKETIFEEGDKVGIIIIENNTPIEKNNLPYVCEDGEWNFDQATAESEGTGKKLYYNNAAATNVAYIVYYPYNALADAATSVDDLKSSFDWKPDQSSESAYRNSDLMVWEKSGAPVAKLDVDLCHVYSSFSITINKMCELDNIGSTEYALDTKISGMSFLAGNKTIHPFLAEDGSYRCILEDGYSGEIRWKYIEDEKSYGGSKTVAGVANTRYSRNETVRFGKYDVSKAQNGDFYCVEENKGYLIPKTASKELLESVTCVGIVFYTGNDLDEDNFGLLGEKHGIAVALHDASLGSNDKFSWAYADDSDVSAWLGQSTWVGDIGRPIGFSSIKDMDKRQGYANTLALKEFNKDEANNTKKNKLIEALDEFAASHNNLPAETSGWYCPSLGEIKTMGRGQGNEGVNEGALSGKNLLNNQLEKIKETNNIPDMDYWSSTEKDSGNAYNFFFKSCWFGSGGSKKGSASYKLRPVFAF